MRYFNMVEMIRCSRGHRFPVNPKKDRDRDYKMCPRCHERVKIRKGKLRFGNPNWGKQKSEQRELRREMKARHPKARSRPQPKSRPEMRIREITDRMALALTLAAIQAKRAKEKEWKPVEE